jgi:hypothetical protein
MTQDVVHFRSPETPTTVDVCCGVFSGIRLYDTIAEIKNASDGIATYCK